MTLPSVTLPAKYPPQPNAPMEIKLTVHAREQDTTVRFSPTIVTNETWVCNTTVSNWSNDLGAVLYRAWAHIQLARAKNWTFDVRYGIRIDNVTAPSPPAGAWVQAKEHFDGLLTDGDIGPDTSVLIAMISAAIDNLKKLAKY